MPNEHYSNAMSLRLHEQVPLWYSLSPMNYRPGLAITTHRETWRAVLRLYENEIDPALFSISSSRGEWVKVIFPFAKGANSNTALQETLAYVFDTLSSVVTPSSHTHPHQFQMAACGVVRSMNNQLKGYLMDAYISYELQQRLSIPSNNKVIQMASVAIKSIARHLCFYAASDLFVHITDEGFLFFGVHDGSGACLGADYRDSAAHQSRVGYAMISDNIDCPDLQLIFLHVLATVANWGRKQQTKSAF